MSSLLTRIANEFSDGGHSIFAPSSSAMYFRCAGSLIANLFEDDEAGEEAAEGTVAHSVAEEWHNTGVRPDHLVGTVVPVSEGDNEFRIPVTESMLDYVGQYVDWCKSDEGVSFTERKVWFTDLMPRVNPDEDGPAKPFPPQGGTADHIRIHNRTLFIKDLKFGRYIQVSAEGNTQILLYAYAAYREFSEFFEIKNVVLGIAQPRLNNFEEWEITVEELLDFAERARSGFEKAWDLNARRQPSVSACTYCKAAASCAALAYTAECVVGCDTYFLGGEFGDEQMSDLRESLKEEYRMRRANAGELETEELAKILPYKKSIENWLKKLEKELQKRALSRKEIPGYKLVESKVNRRFKDEGDLIALLDFIGLDKKKYVTTTIKSPAQMENEIRESVGLSAKGALAVLDKFVTRDKGFPTLAPENDKRPAIDGRVTGAFDDEEDEV